VTGGTCVFDHFQPLCDAFALAEAQQLALPGGCPCFASVHPRAALAAAGLVPAAFEVLDAPAAVTLTDWRRPQPIA
jgi:hypothetical protein